MNNRNQATGPRRYTYSPTMGPPHFYDIDEAGLTYRPPGAEEVVLPWEDIQFLEEGPGQKVDIVAANPERVVPVFLATRNLGDLLDHLCTALSMLHRHRMETITFRATRSYFNQFTVVIGVLIILFMAGVLFLNFFEPAMFLVIAMTVPIAISLVLQPIEVTPGPDGLLVRNFIRPRLIPYTAIATLAFDVRGDLHVSFLRIMLSTHNGRRIKITRFENLILLFIMIKANWHAHAAPPTSD